MKKPLLTGSKGCALFLEGAPGERRSPALRAPFTLEASARRSQGIHSFPRPPVR